MNKLKEKILAIVLVCLGAIVIVSGCVLILALGLKLLGVLLIAAGLIFIILIEPYITRSGL